MAKWGEIKCPRCDEQDAPWEGMERALEESDAREATLNDRITMLEEHLCLAEEKLEKAVEALQTAADDLSGYVGYSYADEYRTTLAELKGQGDE